MAYHATTQRARKEYQCDAEWAHSPRINPGEEYVRVRWMPDRIRPDDGFGEPIFYHPDCYEDGDEW